MDKKIPEIQYTEAQYSMLSKISGGLYVDWWETNSEEWAIIEFLESEGLCSVAGDREFGTWTLTQRGKQVLENKRLELEDQDLESDHTAPRYLPWWAWVPQCVLSVCAIILAVVKLLK